jgi:SAM-dependent methyltransferase
MTPPRPCPGCRSQVSSALGEVGGFSIQACRECRTLFTDHVALADEAEDYTRYYHAGNLSVPPFIHRRLDEVVSSFAHYRQLGRWLDVGFGAGALMQAAAAGGWSVVGTEVAPAAAEAMRAEGFEVHVGELNHLPLPEAAFDVVSMVEVVEHVPDPDALLAAVSKLVRHDGALYITTPHARGASCRLLRTRWSAVSPPEHLQLFSVTGLGSALRRTGFRIQQVRTHAVNLHELFEALRAGHQSFSGGDRVETSYRLNESLMSSGAGRRAKRLANGLLNASRLGDSIKAVAERPG